MDAPYTYETAAALLPEAAERLAELARQAERLQRLALDIRAGQAEDGAVAERKALEAALEERLGWFRDRSVQVKGLAPGLLDFPARALRDGEELVVLLCWREGEEALAWYHRPEDGYAGRAPVAELDAV